MPSPSEFDRFVHNRIEKMHIVGDLIDYRLRYIQHGSGDGKTLDSKIANHNHALFFCWWPTKDIKGGRGKTIPGKSVSIKTMGTWWDTFEISALFIYLIERHRFDQLPMHTDEGLFVDDLLRASNDSEGLLRFFGAYAYLVETFKKVTDDLIYVPVPDSIPRVPISTLPFSTAELDTIHEFESNYLKMR